MVPGGGIDRGLQGAACKVTGTGVGVRIKKAPLV